jgi:acetolactate synthase I/II/III large subunit
MTIPSKAATPRKVADAIAETLSAYGVKHAFGIPGNDVLELIRACSDAGIRFTLSKSEPSAAFMADAVTHVSGKPAACIYALGPGIANGISGMAGALMERAPVIFLGGEMAGNRRAIYNHQVFDHVAATAPVVKYAAELNAERAGQHTARALDIAMTHPRGPVFLNCPADATRAATVEAATCKPIPNNRSVLSADDSARHIQSFAAAKKPVAVVGLGALIGDGPRATRAFLEAWQWPMFATYKAKGILPESHPLCLGAVALSPVMDDISLKLIREAGLIVTIGFDPIELRDAWLNPWAPGQTVISLDHAPQTHRIFPAAEHVIGDIASMLAQLMPPRPAELKWSGQTISAHRQAMAEVIRPRTPKDRISPAALFHAISRRVTPNMTLTVDVGAHRILANHVVQCLTPGQLLQSNGLGCMGYAIPSAIGAALAAPDKPVLAMLGDGSALMSLGELAVVAELDLPVVCVIINDDDLALIDLKQSKMNMTRQGVGFKSPQFAQLARGFGLAASRVSSIDAFDAGLAEALSSKRPAVIEALCDPSEYWEQM